LQYAKSVDEAVEWLKRAPFDGGVEVEIRPIFETPDFCRDFPEFTPELQAQQERLRKEYLPRGRTILGLLFGWVLWSQSERNEILTS
jgi:hypothetical protein